MSAKKIATIIRAICLRLITMDLFVFFALALEVLNPLVTASDD